VHVGLNLIYLVPGETGGTEVVARELLPALAAARPGVRFTSFVNFEAADTPSVWSDIGDVVTVPVRASNRAQWVRGEQLLLPRLAHRSQVDLVHSLANTGPARGDFKRVVTIHDLIHRIHPETHSGLRSAGMRVLVSLAARRADRVITDAVSTRDDLVRLLGIPADKIDVAPLGLGARAAVEPRDEREIRRLYDLGDRHLLFTVSAKRPHKNLARLLEALALIPATSRPVLVLPGYPTPYEAELRRLATDLGLDADTRFLGWLPDAEIEGLYAAAACFVFPSLYEGFGMPVLEAMSRGLPVVCSDRGSLREVAGDAALLFDPASPRSIADAVQRILSDQSLAARLRDMGRLQASRFTWRATADATLASYDRALAASA
jgi:glycosyltransferase involved in cell wall biosynthesis